MLQSSLVLSLPDWIEPFLAAKKPVFKSIEQRMQLIIDLARLNIKNQLAGPFAAGIFDQETGQLISCGVNIVINSHCSIAHAETMAIGLAQQTLGNYDLSEETFPAYQLVTSSEPCAMCLGAISWSGLRSVICGSRDEDVRKIGFDEGHKPTNWIEALKKRGISVKQDVLRNEAIKVLEQYKDAGGIIYNAAGKNSCN